MWDNPYYVIAFILGFIIIGFSLSMFLFPKKNSHLVIKLLFDITYIIQMLFIYFATGTMAVFAGIASNTVGAIRDIAFIRHDKKEERFYWTLGLCALMIILLQFSYDSPASYLPVFGTLINTYALSLKNKRNTCALTICGQMFFISYYFILLKDSDFLTVLNIVSAFMLLMSAIIGLVLSLIKRFVSNKANH